MLKARFVVGMVPVSLMVLGVGVASGQTTSTGSGQAYPNKPLRIVTAGVGGGNDFTARLIAQEIAGPLGQQVIVDNRAGAVIPGEIVSKAPPDGYTLLGAGGTFTIGPLLQKTPYDVVKDFVAVVLTNISPNILVVNLQLPVKSVKELIAWAKAKPGALNYATGGTGSQVHLAGELFKAMTGVNIVRIPYKSGGAAIIDVIAGESQMMFPNPPTAMVHIKSGRLRALAVTSAEPSALAPGLPTMAASGVPGYEVISMDFIFAPANTPATVINRLNQEIARAINKADVKQKFFDAGADVVGSLPEESATRLKTDVAKWEKVIKEAGIRVE